MPGHLELSGRIYGQCGCVFEEYRCRWKNKSYYKNACNAHKKSLALVLCCVCLNVYVFGCGSVWMCVAVYVCAPKYV